MTPERAGAERRPARGHLVLIQRGRLVNPRSPIVQMIRRQEEKPEPLWDSGLRLQPVRGNLPVCSAKKR